MTSPRNDTMVLGATSGEFSCLMKMRFIRFLSVLPSKSFCLPSAPFDNYLFWYFPLQNSIDIRTFCQTHKKEKGKMILEKYQI